MRGAPHSDPHGTSARRPEHLTAVHHEVWGPDVRAIQKIAAVPQILRTMCQLTGMGFSTVARVTAESWVCCAAYDVMGFGMKPGTELDLRTTLCRDIRLTAQPVVIDEVAIDVTFADHPTPRLYRFQSNISVPIILKDGSVFGTLCAIDPQPRPVSSPEIVSTIRLFADLIARELDLMQVSAGSATPAADGSATAGHDQFIAVLRQDVRDPLAGVAEASRRSGVAPTQLQDGLERVTRKLDDVLDFARGQFGGGFALQRDFPDSFEAELKPVVDAQCAASGRDIALHVDVQHAVNCDVRRIRQMLSYLLANAIAYGDAASPIRVEATTDSAAFRLAVINSGAPIAPERMPLLLQPYARADGHLGLGLTIAAGIARAHGGTLDVESSNGETRVTFVLPLWIMRPSD